MTFPVFEELLANLQAKEQSMSLGKGKEYANNDADRLANFKDIAKDLDITPEAVCMIYLEKHLRSIKSFVKYGKTFSEEPIHGRITDARLYLALLIGLIMDTAEATEAASAKQKKEKQDDAST